MEVAVVDYQAPDAPERFTESLRGTGFAVIVNHPLRQSLVEQIHREWLAFFDSDAKYEYAYREGDQDGYFAPDVSETAKGNSVRDLKEFFHVYPWGQYPTEVSDAALVYRDEATAIARTLLDWVEANTPPEVEERFSMPLAHMLDGSKRTLLRILRYPPLTGDEPEGALRAANHEDINLLTVLPASNEPGLQVRDLAGNWHDVPCDFGSIAVNSGDMLQLASGGYYPSTTHRVINPTGEGAKRSRLALPLFLHPADDVRLSPDKTAFEYLQERIRELRSQDLNKA
jgi:isopenicillin N synthase-like dioxygenase